MMYNRNSHFAMRPQCIIIILKYEHDEEVPSRSWRNWHFVVDKRYLRMSVIGTRLSRPPSIYDLRRIILYYTSWINREQQREVDRVDNRHDRRCTYVHNINNIVYEIFYSNSITYIMLYIGYELRYYDITVRLMFQNKWCRTCSGVNVFYCSDDQLWSSNVSSVYFLINNLTCSLAVYKLLSETIFTLQIYLNWIKSYTSPILYCIFCSSARNNFSNAICVVPHQWFTHIRCIKDVQQNAWI